MAKIDSQRSYLNKSLVVAAASASLSRVRAALEDGASLDFRDEAQCGWTALHFACYFSCLERSAERICEVLLLKGADPDVLSADGASALLTASSVGSIGAVELLIKRQADLDLADRNGYTALMGAADRGEEAIVAALLGAGANVALRDSHGRSAMDFAHRKGLLNIVAMIEAEALGQSIPKPGASPSF